MGSQCEVGRAHRFVAAGDHKYRMQDYTGAAAAYREAASIFGKAMVNVDDEDARDALTVLRDSHVRKAERIDGLVSKNSSDIECRASARPAAVGRPELPGVTAKVHSHLHPPSSPTSVPASPSSGRVRPAAEPWQRFLSVLSRPLGDLTHACRRLEHMQPHSLDDGDVSPPNRHEVNERLMGSVFLVASPVTTPKTKDDLVAKVNDFVRVFHAESTLLRDEMLASGHAPHLGSVGGGVEGGGEVEGGAHPFCALPFSASGSGEVDDLRRQIALLKCEYVNL